MITGLYECMCVAVMKSAGVGSVLCLFVWFKTIGFWPMFMCKNCNILVLFCGCISGFILEVLVYNLCLYLWFKTAGLWPLFMC